MSTDCKSCGQAFTTTDADLAFYDKVSPVFGENKCAIPPPTYCPNCRQRRRQTWRNERHLYHHKCALSGKQMISMYSPDKPFVVYEQKEWWSDKWNGLDFGVEYDFSRSFFEQFDALQRQVPHINLCNDSASINCDFVNQTTYQKNCYLVYDSDYCEQVYYSHLAKKSLSCIDCFRIFDCELCSDCVDCRNCYQAVSCQDCENCTDSYFLKDCIGCQNCLGCIGLRNQQYCIFNVQYTKAQYESALQKAVLHTWSGLQLVQQQATEFHRKQPVKEHHNVQVENSTADYLRNTKEARDCFDCSDIHDCVYCCNVHNHAKDCMDYEVWGENAQLIYECVTCGENAQRLLFSESCWSQVSDLLYCTFCMHSSHLFGCTGLKGNQYCILNRQYTQAEYEDLVPKIIEHMTQGGEFGEFFPTAMSPFCYNETLAGSMFPLTRDQVVDQGWQWYDEDQKKASYMGPAVEIPDSIGDIDDAICEKICLCETTKKPYKIISQELALCRQMNIPLPRLHPDERHQKRVERRNPRQLWDRQCAKCQKAIHTTYSPDRPEIVYCEPCYVEVVS